MLTACDKVSGGTVRLPDVESRAQLESVRERTRRGELVCGACRQPLWLRAGTIRIPHFGHRSLNDCPQGRVSEAVLDARLHLYRFFRARIEAGKLPGEIELEPQVPDLPAGATLDLLLRRPDKPWVAICILESSLKPEVRWNLRSFVRSKRWLLRPVFLEARLKRAPQSDDQFLLDTTQREFRLSSPYDLPAGDARGRSTLHFIAPGAERWITLRGLFLVHDPQLFMAGAVRTASMQELLWSEAHAEWVHPGEAEALKAFRQAAAEEEQRRRTRRMATLSVDRSVLDRTASSPSVSPCDEIEDDDDADDDDKDEDQGENDARDLADGIEDEDEDEDQEAEEDEEADLEEREPPPAWMLSGLTCVGCGQRTVDWQNASPGQDSCVCRACFAKGVRLH